MDEILIFIRGMVKPFITDMGEKLKMTDQKTGQVVEIPQYAYWEDLGRNKPEVKEVGDDLEVLKRKYNVPDNAVFSMEQFRQNLKEAVQQSGNHVILIDSESSDQKFRKVFSFKSSFDLPKFIDWFKRYRPKYYENVVQFVDEKSGETMKGPKYDTTEQDASKWSIEYLLQKSGVKQQSPIEPTQHEPRDRFNEEDTEGYKSKIVIRPQRFGYYVIPYDASGMVVGSGLLRYPKNERGKAIDAANYLHTRYGWPIVDLTKEKPMSEEINKFRNMIRECISEIKKENDPRERLKESLRGMVKDVIKEIANIAKPELDKDEKETISKGYNKKNKIFKVDKICNTKVYDWSHNTNNTR